MLISRETAEQYINEYTKIGAKCFKPFTKRQVSYFFWEWIKQEKPLNDFESAFNKRLEKHNTYWENLYASKIKGFTPKVIGKAMLLCNNNIVIKTVEHCDYVISIAPHKFSHDWVRRKIKQYCDEMHVNINVEQLISYNKADVIIRPHL